MVKIGNALRSEIEKAAAFPGQVVFKRTARPLAAKVVTEQAKKPSAIQRFLMSQSGGIKTAAPTNAAEVPVILQKILKGPYAKGYIPRKFVPKAEEMSMVRLSKSPGVSKSYIKGAN